MLTLVQFLEELEHNKQSIVVSGEEVERLAERFGPAARGTGTCSRATDGSVQIPMANIIEAVQSLDVEGLTEAVQQLKSSDSLTDLLSRSSAAARLIEALSELHLRQFQRRVERYQESNDPAEVERLRHEISRELFGA